MQFTEVENLFFVFVAGVTEANPLLGELEAVGFRASCEAEKPSGAGT